MSESRTSFVRLFVGFILSATGACCPIELSPPSVVVKYGDPVSVNCSTSERMHEGMGWEASYGGTSLEMVNQLTWTLEHLTEWSVSPACFINYTPINGTLDQCTKDLKVVVYTFPETIHISPNDVRIEGKQYNLTCDIPNVAPVQNLTVWWYKGNKIFNIERFDNPSKAPVDQSSVLTITPTRLDEGVKFRCEAHLDLGPEGPQLNVSSEELTTIVHFGPDIQCSAVVELLEGETLKSQCPVTGNPTPNVKWLKDGVPADLNHPMSREKAGLYSIEAEGFSFIQKKIQVLVMYGPELKCPSNYIAMEYTPHNLTCTVEGYPKPETIWYKDGDEVELPENLTRRDAGQYLIYASNNHSSVYHTVELVIIYPPSQIVELEDSVVEVGSTVWLKCSSTGNPRPTYSWSYYRTANVMEENEDGVSRLLIHSVTVYNLGSYTCQASNERGNISKTVRVTVKDVKQECPIKITPDWLVIPYQGKAQNIICEPKSSDSTNVKEIHWQGFKSNKLIWQPHTQNDSDLSPVCTATFEGIGTCQKPLNFILYKTPDRISIRPVDNCSLLEDEKCQLQCDIINVAPARNLTVRWYHGNDTIEAPIKDSLQVTGCPPKNNTNCDIRTPVNVSSTISIILNRTHSKAEFRCEAQLDLRPEGPQLPNITSSPLNITVYYKPVINDTKHPKTIPVFTGYPEVLVCEADGYPPPKIQWLYSPDKSVSGDRLNVSEPGFYTCNATNEVGSVSHVFKVILKEDYLPLIAGFVAVTVVIISVIFLFIYSIYYKNTKMRRYSLKNPKLSTHNSNVAHNGWDLQFPMTKLS